MKLIFFNSLRFAFFLVLCSGLTAEEKTEDNNAYIEENQKIVNELKKDKNLVQEVEKEQTKPSEIDKKKASNSEHFFMLGGSIGTPNGINLNLGYNYKRLILQASGGYFNKDWWGGQGKIGYSFWKTSVMTHSVSLAGGTYSVNPYNPIPGKGGQNEMQRSDVPGYRYDPPRYEEYAIRQWYAQQNPTLAAYLEYQYRTQQKAVFTQSYLGITYDIFLGGFFVQLGLGWGRGDFKSPQLLLQFGYLFDFR